ncbi:hypothetical protein [Acinetobacter baumannii]|uniref:hypothetical protein n=1 Tax=Acinetobacter baumannii TaxID=470 RepID=UPI001CDBFBAF|nr:hypothetical protein [Acinetobacter baumannii]MCA4232747.1 hypothetical protein [Acinetobacter baumannii]
MPASIYSVPESVSGTWERIFRGIGVMDVQKINVTNVLQGTTEDVVEQIFKIFIGQIHDKIQKDDPAQALDFAFLVAGNGIAALLNQVADHQIDDMAKLLHEMVDEATENLKAMQIKKS